MSIVDSPTIGYWYGMFSKLESRYPCTGNICGTEPGAKHARDSIVDATRESILVLPPTVEDD